MHVQFLGLMLSMPMALELIINVCNRKRYLLISGAEGEKVMPGEW